MSERSTEETPTSSASKHSSSSDDIEKKARMRRYAKETAILRSRQISFQKIFMWRQVFEDLLDTDMNGHMEDEDLHKVFEDLEQEMDEEDVADMHEFFRGGGGTTKEAKTPSESPGEVDASSKSNDAHSMSFVAFVLAMEKERTQNDGANAKKCFEAVFDMFKAKPKDKTLKKDDLLMGFQMLKVGFADGGEFEEFFKVGKKSKGFAQILGRHASYIDDDDVRRAREKKKKKKKTGKGKTKAKKKTAPAKAVVVSASDAKYAKYFRMAKILPAAAILQRAEMDGLTPEEIEALKIATAK